jgi:3-oxoacyl-[acyl-carrier protein] reductase
MGQAIAVRLAEAGAAVVVNAKTSTKDAAGVVRQIQEKGGRAQAILADITDPKAVRAMAEQAVAAFGRVDVLINTVALRSHTPLPDISLQEWRAVLGSVLDGSFLCAQALAPQLVANKGTIVNIGGASAHFGQKHHAAVMTAKMGLIGLTRSLAIDLAPDVVVNCLIPGRIDGPNDNRAGSTRYPMDRVPAGRAGTLEEVAEAVMMLCSPKCRFITGQAIHISGGMLFGL